MIVEIFTIIAIGWVVVATTALIGKTVHDSKKGDK